MALNLSAQDRIEDTIAWFSHKIQTEPFAALQNFIVDVVVGLLKEIGAERDSLEESSSLKDRKIAELSATCDTLSTQVKDISAQRDQALLLQKRTEGDTKACFEDQEEAYKQLLADRDALNADRKGLRQKLDAATKELQAIEGERKNALSKKIEAENAVIAARDIFTKQEADLKKLTEEHDTLQKEIDALRLARRQADDARHAADEQLQQARKEIEQLKADRNGLEEKVVSTAKIVDKLETSLAHAQARMGELQAENRKLTLRK